MEGKNKIELLNNFLTKENLDCLLIPMRDAFNSEYLPHYFNRIRQVSNFTGSNGYIVFLKNQKSLFFTDGRYTLQAKQELDLNQFSIYDFEELTPLAFLKGKNLGVGFDGNLHTIDEVRNYQRQGISLKEVGSGLEKIFSVAQPKPKKIFEIPIKEAGLSATEKFKQVLGELGQDYLLLNDPTSICWLLNIRGADLEHTPIVFSYALVSKAKGLEVFLDIKKLEIGREYNFEINPIQEFEQYLPKLKSVRLNPKTTSFNHYNLISGEKFEASDIVTELKSIKNASEIKNIKKAHIRDAKAFKLFFDWLSEVESTSEIEVAEKLLEFRKKDKNFVGPSFDTIAGFNENGAIVHYHATPKTNKKISGNGLLLLDSGGQYRYGTTDVTRTIAIGRPTAEQKEYYTLVLKAHIALLHTNFPQGTTGASLDGIVRKFFWDKGLDFNHGTGHGVGYFLNVHEGPASISKRGFAEIKEGMVLSNEPGLYFENKYGVRIENLVQVVKSYRKGLLTFRNLTIVPYEEKLINFNSLNMKEASYLMHYHRSFNYHTTGNSDGA
jgi:Xaa-Pro aminopeptidase